jgi:hypothetical protein
MGSGAIFWPGVLVSWTHCGVPLGRDGDIDIIRDIGRDGMGVFYEATAT